MARHRYTNEEIEAWRMKNQRTVYANRDDTRIFVPKGYGIGYTLNWGNPVAYIVFLAIIAIPVFISVFFAIYN